MDANASKTDVISLLVLDSKPKIQSDLTLGGSMRSEYNREKGYLKLCISISLFISRRMGNWVCLLVNHDLKLDFRPTF